MALQARAFLFFSMCTLIVGIFVFVVDVKPRKVVRSTYAALIVAVTCFVVTKAFDIVPMIIRSLRRRREGRT